MTLVAVAPDKFTRGFDGSGREAPERYEVLELRDALTRTYGTDAHLVTYVVVGAKRQPRINKAGLAAFGRRVETGVFLCDVDNPGHAAWSEALRAAARRQYDELDVLARAGVYHTEHGQRIVQPIADPLPVESLEPYLRRWLHQLEDAGIRIDWACRDWTRHFRLPHVRRKVRAYRSPLVELGRMAPIPLDPLVAEPTDLVRRVSGRRRGPHVRGWSATLPLVWDSVVEQLASAVGGVGTEWHTLFLALAGALLSRGVPPEHVPALCRAISIATGRDSRIGDREAAARSTTERWLGGQPVTGYRTLALQWPDVADALDGALARGRDARLRASARAAPETIPRPLGEVRSALEAVIRHAPDGLTLISAECGLGKTQAALHVAIERAAKPYVTPAATGQRAPPQSRTSISVDKHELAAQICRDIARTGTPVQRLFGPLSLLGLDGETPVCQYHAQALPLVEGGQSMQWELCEGRDAHPCPHRTTCPAAEGAEGPSDARIAVGPHALLSRLAGLAGTTGLLVIDEPPDLLETVTLSVEELLVAQRALPAFYEAYAVALAPALELVTAWVSALGPVGTPVLLGEGLRACGFQPPALARARPALGLDGDAVACAIAAPFPPERRNKVPPLDLLAVLRARQSIAYARELGTASKALKWVYHALASPVPVAARIDAERRLVLTSAREGLMDALRREGSVVVTDANADLHAPILAKVVGYDPPLHRFTAPDGAPVTRTMIRCRSATRRGWLPDRKLTVGPSLRSAVRAAFAWVAEDGSARKLALITFAPLALVFRALADPADGSVESLWKEAGQPRALLAEACASLGPIVRCWPGRIVVGHYGGVRGLDHMADVDSLMTLGDPWPNLGDVQSDAAFLGLEEVWEARLEALCRAELEQAHGRLRAVHRAHPARALHVGNVLPGGSGWSSDQVELRRLVGGRPKTESAMDLAELDLLVARLGGLRAAARAIGCDHAVLARLRRGDRPVSAAVARALRTSAGIGAPLPVTTTPGNRDLSDQGFGSPPPSPAPGFRPNGGCDDPLS